jgi:hypothetical protein
MNLPFLSRRSKRRYLGQLKPPGAPKPKPSSKTRKLPQANVQLQIRAKPQKLLIPKSQSPQLASQLCQLPYDVIQIVYRSLPAAAKAALALTCHGFWANRDPAAIRQVQSSQVERTKFLSLLDDNKGFLRCSACVTSHPLRGYEMEDTPTGLKLSGEGKCEKRTGEVRVCGHYKLQYRMLLLVFRAERLGAEYGLPVSRLEHRCKIYPWPGQDLEMETHVKGRVVDGRLLLRLTYRIRVDLLKTEEHNWERQVKELLRRPVLPQPMFRKWKAMSLGRHREKIKKPNDCHPAVDVGCIHSHTSLPHFAAAAIRSYSEQAKELPDKRLWENWELNRDLENCCKIHQCRYCATDFIVHVSPTDEPFECLLNIVAYKDLGSSLPHTSTLWAAATHPFGYVLDRSQALPYGAKSIRSVFAPLEHGGDENDMWKRSEMKGWRSAYRCLQEWKPEPWWC